MASKKLPTYTKKDEQGEILRAMFHQKQLINGRQQMNRSQ